ncbi:MAG: diaminopimelate epimerase [bacterium]|nr:diaminopimelate epimerase [bacterium]MDD5354378.1 diaminopimelate epimerase [bacterium]MDD5756429.1 diaminopimelate epimerase [bacterium]
MRKIKFAKFSGAGNDFVVIDNRRKIVPSAAVRLAVKLCQPKTGIGADGLILLERSAQADFRMRIFNPDGSEAEMCGNGARCIARFASLKKIAPAKMIFETMAGLISAQVKDRDVKLHMSDPHSLKDNLSVKLGGQSRKVLFINTGVPHAIMFVNNIDKVPVFEWGRIIRYHRLFKPAGTNVNFVSKMDQHTIAIRTYERGVENETLACGTGSVAAAIVSAYARNLSSPVQVHTRGGDILTVYFKFQSTFNAGMKGAGKTFYDVYMEGRVKFVFEGELKES